MLIKKVRDATRSTVQCVMLTSHCCSNSPKGPGSCFTHDERAMHYAAWMFRRILGLPSPLSSRAAKCMGTDDVQFLPAAYFAAELNNLEAVMLPFQASRPD
eukprot:1142299-Amphidinium_carterae.2